MIRLCVVLVLFVTSGCTPFLTSFQTVDSSVLSSEYQRHPVAAEDVEVFLASDIIPAECRRVALLRAAPLVTVVDNLRAEAGRLGANALDLRDYRTPEVTRSEMAERFWDVVALHCPTEVARARKIEKGGPRSLKAERNIRPPYQ